GKRNARLGIAFHTFLIPAGRRQRNRRAVGRLPGGGGALSGATRSGTPLRVRPDRQPQREARAAAGRRVHLDRPAMLLRNAVADAQSEPGAFADRLGGEERIEDPPADLRVDALAAVDHVDRDATLLASRPHRPRAPIGPRVYCVGY